MKPSQRTKLHLLDFGSAFTWGLAWVILAHTLATPAAAWAGMLFSFVGFFLGRRAARTELRTASGAAIALVLGVLLVKLAEWPTRSPFLAGLFPSPASLVSLTDFFAWGCTALLVVGTFQFVSRRYPTVVSLEVLLVSLCLATPFAAHRDGFINRPYFLIDPLWSRGYDPMPVLQALGVALALALVLLTIGRVSRRSSLFDLAILAVVALVLYLYLPQETLRDLVADPPGQSGLTGEPEEAPPPPPGSGQEPMSGGSGKGSSSQSEDPFPFESSDREEPKAVAVVVFRDDYDPPEGYYYFRQTAFSQYNGFRLVKDTTDLADADLFRRFATRVESLPAPTPRFGQPTERLQTRVALLSSHKEPFGLVSPLTMAPAPNPKPDQFERAYDVESLVYTGDYSDIVEITTLDSPDWTPELKAHYLGHPTDPRYPELAQRITSELPEEYRDLPLAKAIAINLYLGEHGKYTLRPRPVGDSEDPTADFLFGDMTGYCVHFSHAAVYLMRSVGVPARVGAGYAVESRNRRGSALLIRSAEAHAWPEIWVDGLGWYPFDVAPQTNLDSPVPPPDFDLQAMLAEMAREDSEVFDQPPQFDLRNWLRNIVEKTVQLVPWLLAALMLLAYGLKLERRLAPKWEKTDDHGRLLYRAALDRLTEVGVVREYGQGRLSFAEQHAQLYPSLTVLTEAHLARAFGSGSGRAGSPSPSREELRVAYQKLGREIAQRFPLWRRLLGLLNPVSWLRTK